MKLSLSWIIDHIKGIDDIYQVYIPDLMAKFNSKVAEIEDSVLLKENELMYMAIVLEITDQFILAEIPALNKKIKLKTRPDAKVGDIFLVELDRNSSQDEYCWVKVSPFSGGEECRKLVPAFSISQDQLKTGSWRELIDGDDFIFEVDNKSITHRPDMWGHRGFAREIALLLDKDLIEESQVLSDEKIVQSVANSGKVVGTDFSFENQDETACSSFSLAHFESAENKACDVKIAFRLLNVGIKPINALVDLTNYLMLDWGQPTHAYDAAEISGKKLIVRKAGSKEKIVLLDGETKELTSNDLIISDQEKPLGLAGVMGGLESSITSKTNSVLFESATFDATTIRRSAQHHKIRTESSSRFEKTLDTQTSIKAVQRFIKLAQDANVSLALKGNICQFGKPVEPTFVKISHEELESKIGVQLKQDQVTNPLEKLGFKVEENSGIYNILVPEFRAKKDVQKKHDIVEEIVRSFGFNQIPDQIPSIEKKPSNLDGIFKTRSLKNYFAYGQNMIEQWNYPMINEDFAKKIGYNPENCPQILNPVSQNAFRMTPSLIPGLLKNVQDNYANYDQLKFFESARVWTKVDDKSKDERKSVAGVWFEKKGEIDFFDGKEIVSKISNVLNLPEFEWSKIENKYDDIWLDQNLSAQIFLGSNSIGYAGIIDPKIFDKLGFIKGGSGFCFEIELTPLLKTNWKQRHLQPLSKYQNSYFDICLQTSKETSVKSFSDKFASADKLIKNVEMISKFEKKEWNGDWAIAFRIWLENPNSNISKEEIDSAQAKIVQISKELGAELR